MPEEFAGFLFTSTRLKILYSEYKVVNGDRYGLLVWRIVRGLVKANL